MKRKEIPRWAGAALAAIGLAAMGFGAARGEMATVFTKAVKICLECIGIG